MEIIVTTTYSSFAVFPQTVKSLSKTVYLQEIENPVWKLKKKYPFVLKDRCCCDGYYVYKVEYWLWISKAYWNLGSFVTPILTQKAYPKFCSLYRKKQELQISGYIYY